MRLILRLIAGSLIVIGSASFALSIPEGYHFDPQTKKLIPYGNHHYKGKSRIKREVVVFEKKYSKGTIIVNTTERRLYFVLGNGKAIKYGIGVGREGFQWAGSNRVSRKAEWPSWTPTPAMRKRDPSLPRHMKGGIDNPLGARALYIGSTYYRIHGSNEPWSIGQAVSSGCIRLTNDDIEHLYELVSVGARVVVTR